MSFSARFRWRRRFLDTHLVLERSFTTKVREHTRKLQRKHELYTATRVSLDTLFSLISFNITLRCYTFVYNHFLPKYLNVEMISAAFTSSTVVVQTVFNTMVTIFTLIIRHSC